MNKIEEAKLILEKLKYKDSNIGKIDALTFLAICRIKPEDKWVNAEREGVTVTKGIMDFISNEYDVVYAPNSRETVRRKVLHCLLNKGIIEYNPFEPGLPTNSPRAHYAISEEVLSLVRNFGKEAWDEKLNDYLYKEDKIKINNRDKRRVELKTPEGERYSLSPGKHNQLQADIVTVFSSKNLSSCEIIYLGDTENKNLILNEEMAEKLNIKIEKGTKLPDVVLYDKSNHTLYIFEAVTSHGPISELRLKDLERIFDDSGTKKVYITAFDNFSMLGKHYDELAYGTEVWISKKPNNRMKVI